MAWCTVPLRTMCSQAYNEWTYNFYTVSRWGFIGKASRLLACILTQSAYKDNFTEYSNVRFERGCFPSVDRWRQC